MEASSKRLKPADPWLHRRFNKDFRGWILQLEPVLLRSNAIKNDLLTNTMIAELEAKASPAAHNALFLSYVMPGERKSFMAFLDVIDDMGSNHKRKEFEELLSNQQQDEPDGPPAAAAAAAAAAAGGGGGSHVKATPVRSVDETDNVRDRYIDAIDDLYKFGEDLGKNVSKEHRRKLARAFVKARDEPIHNYKDIVEDHMKSHGHPPAKETNAAGLLFYLIDDSASRPTCGDLLDMLKETASDAAVEAVASILETTTFKKKR